MKIEKKVKEICSSKIIFFFDFQHINSYNGICWNTYSYVHRLFRKHIMRWHQKCLRKAICVNINTPTVIAWLFLWSVFPFTNTKSNQSINGVYFFITCDHFWQYHNTTNAYILKVSYFLIYYNLFIIETIFMFL